LRATGGYRTDWVYPSLVGLFWHGSAPVFFSANLYVRFCTLTALRFLKNWRFNTDFHKVQSSYRDDVSSELLSAIKPVYDKCLQIVKLDTAVMCQFSAAAYAAIRLKPVIGKCGEIGQVHIAVIIHIASYHALV